LVPGTTLNSSVGRVSGV